MTDDAFEKAAKRVIKATSRKERFLFWLACRLPLTLVYYATVRGVNLVMTESEDATELRAYQVLRRLRACHLTQSLGKELQEEPDMAQNVAGD